MSEDILSFIPELAFIIVGLALIALGFYLIIKVYPFSSFRDYSYISQKERWRGSIKGGIGSAILILGFLFVAFPISFKETSFNLLLLILGFGFCMTPIIVPLAIFRIYRDLWAYTKQEGDMVTIAENKERH